jgi:glucose 1-dehydrogenase
MKEIKSVFASNCLENKLVLLSGASGDLGTVIVNYLLFHGAEVVMTDIKASHENQINQEKLHYYELDVTNEAAVVSFYDQINAKFSKSPDVVICHAGIVHLCSFHEESFEKWKKTYDVNTNGVFLFAREALKRMRGNFTYDNPGKLIFTSSWCGTVPQPRTAAYNSSKAAVDMLMKSIAREYAQEHIRVNCVTPGIVGVGMALHAYNTDAIYRSQVDKMIPVGKFQTPETVAEAMIFLCSAASNYMTGTSLTVDGGNSLYPLI